MRLYLCNYGMLFSDTMRLYLQQLRQETGLRVCEKAFDPQTDKPSKVSSHYYISYIKLYFFPPKGNCYLILCFMDFVSKKLGGRNKKINETNKIKLFFFKYRISPKYCQAGLKQMPGQIRVELQYCINLCPQ